MKGYSFSELVKLAESMVPLGGGIMTGNLTAPKFFMSAAQDPAANAAVRKDYLESVLDQAGYKTVVIEAVHTAVPGQYIPITLRGLGAYGGEIGISTKTGGESEPMNCNTFVGKVFSGGWTDQGSWVSGVFKQYLANERAIAGISAGSEMPGAIAIYVESRAFPVTLRVPRDSVVYYTGADVSINTSVFPTRMGPNYTAGTKTTELIDFRSGSGYYDTLSYLGQGVTAGYGNFTDLRVIGAQGNANESVVRRDYLLSSLNTKFDKTGGTVSGSVVVQGSADIASYVQIRGATNPMMEFHQPDSSAVAVFKPSGKSALRVGHSNGGGVEVYNLMEVSQSALELNGGNYQTNYQTKRAWTEIGKAMLHGGSANTQAQTLDGFISKRLTVPGAHSCEYGYGVVSNINLEDGAHAFFCTDGSEYNRYWLLTNGDTLRPPSGNWQINPNGDLYSSRLGGTNVVDWAMGAFPVKNHNHTAASGNLDIVQGQNGVVGSYIFAALNPAQNASKVNPGGTVAGAHLYAAACAEYSQNRAWNFSGTWMCMGYVDPNTDDRWDDRATLWFRIA